MKTKNRDSDGIMNTIIGKGSVFEGSLQVSHSIRVDGTLQGGELISPETLVVGQEGEIRADLKVKDAVINGKIIGNLEASDSVILESNAVMLGDLKTRILIIEEGAVFRGNCQSGKDIEDIGHESADQQVSVNEELELDKDISEEELRKMRSQRYRE